MRSRSSLFALLSLLVFCWSPLLFAESVEEEINHLIQAVANSNCEFVRNGDRYDANDHLRLKYRRGKRYATSAENFIDRLASKSSWSGNPYSMVCQDSGEHSSNSWLHAELLFLRGDREGGE